MDLLEVDVQEPELEPALGKPSQVWILVPRLYPWGPMEYQVEVDHSRRHGPPVCTLSLGLIFHGWDPEVVVEHGSPSRNPPIGDPQPALHGQFFRHAAQ